MPNDPRKYLEDMVLAARHVSEILGVSDITAYLTSLSLRSAVERQLQIVGEALYQLDRRHPAVASRIVSYRDIINFRHVLVHGYDTLNDSAVYSIAVNRVPGLAREVIEPIEELGDVP